MIGDVYHLSLSTGDLVISLAHSQQISPRRGVAEPWGGPDRRELLGELVRHAAPSHGEVGDLSLQGGSWFLDS